MNLSSVQKGLYFLKINNGQSYIVKKIVYR
ncbi:MAG: T9SS type A sorting domain-containing protein [Cytophagales bacterium]|nr:T9SS type A sorting domain-containing protein [Cytophagales bacterium]